MKEIVRFDGNDGLVCIDKIVNKTKSKVGFIRNNLSNEVIQEKVSNKLSEKIILDDLEFQYNLSGINFYEELEKFLSIQRSTHTKTGYKISIMGFIDYCEKNRIKLLEVGVRDVDGYQSFLMSKYSNKSIRTKMLGISSFYTFLLYRYPKVFKINPFQKRKLPIDVCKNKKDFVTDNDVLELKRELTRIKRYDLVTIVELLKKYGFRVGIFCNMEIDKNGRWFSDSKGKGYDGKFTKKELDKLIKYDVLSLTRTTIINTIKKYIHKLYLRNVVSCDFSVHDLRRYYIKKKVKSCKNGEEILKFSRTIHKNINTTMNYI
jgi:hypothetical protein